MTTWYVRTSLLGLLAMTALALPTPVAAQLTKAGVVITLEGNATLVRSTFSGPRAVALDDDVFVHDRIITGDAAFARLLLAGKAILAIRERSAITITEVPGKATIELDAGAASLTVDTTRQKPGEMIEIRTANAAVGLIAWHHGSGAQREDSVFASVSRLAAGAVDVSRPESGGCGLQSEFVVLRGVATVVAFDLSAQTVEPQVKLRRGQTVTIGCGSPGPVGTLTRAEIEGLIQTYRTDDIPIP